jgi:2-C-methyl-D-erythritol 4-phosphate cytidylyltransferase
MPEGGKVTTSVILAAAGASTRLRAEVRKPYIEVAGEPIFYHSLELFTSLESLLEFVIVVHPLDRPDFTRNYGAQLESLPVPVHVVPGGEHRSESIARALDAASADADLIAIHDAVRPFTEPAVIRRVVARARETGAAIAATRVSDTVKAQGRGEGSEAPSIEATVPRRGLWFAQTPQVFHADLIRRAYRQFGPDPDATDDAELVERLGHPVSLVEGGRLNIKITTREDLELARAITAHVRGARTPG